ncbi:MAG: efflux RND transporter periplasmic adaptor subunit [Aureispira sp.]
MKKHLCLLGIVLVLAACHHHHHHDHEGHGLNAISYTMQQGNIEAFVELLPPVVGQAQTVEIILSQLQPLHPLDAQVQLRLNNQAAIPLNSTTKGVYNSSILPKDTLPQQLTFLVEIDRQKLRFELPPLPVATSVETAKQTIYPQKDKVGSIAFGRAKMWNSNFILSPAQQRSIGQIIHTSGSIEPANSNLITMVARRDGVVSLRKKNLTSGTAVQAGELLFSVAGRGIVSDDLEMNFVKAQSNLKRQESNLERKRQLLDEQIIGQKEFDESLNNYQVAEAEYKNIKKVFNKGSKRHLVTAPAKGFLAQVGVHEGEFVQAGQQLATLLQTNRLQVRVDVSPRYGSLLPLVVDANFINPYSNKAYSLASLEGSILSFGKMTSHEEGHYLPFYFEINNHPELLPGTLIEVYLSTQATTSPLSIPQSAVFEEMGSQVVFVQRSGGSYDKQVVQLGATDGEYVQVLNGLSEGDYVVSQGALRIKLASMTGTVDPHAGHNH